MTDDLISIVVPIYNVEKYLKKCVESLIAQTYKNIEIILVDDGSTDESGMICDEFSQKYNNVKVIHKENGGLSSARNAGIEIADGTFIGFVDSDDFVAKEMYETLLKGIVQNEADIAICNCYMTYENGRKCLRFKSENDLMVMNSIKAIVEMNSFKTFDMAAWNKLYRKQLFEEIRFPEGKLSEDYYIMYKLFDNSKRIVYINKPLYFYMQRKGSISKTPQIHYDFVEAAKQQMYYVERKYPEVKNIVHAAYASACMTIYNILIINGGKCAYKDKSQLKGIVKEELIYVKNNPCFSFSKKLQAYLFVYALPLYNCFYYIYKLSKGWR